MSEQHDQSDRNGQNDAGDPSGPEDTSPASEANGANGASPNASSEASPDASASGEAGASEAERADAAPAERRVVTPERMAHGSDAIGRLKDGRIVFVAGGLPGEAVEIARIEEHAGYERARAAAAPASPSPDRAPPRCPYFGAWPERGEQPEAHCGGCQWQHARYEAQLRFKRTVVADALHRLGAIDDPPVEPAIGMDRPWRYRNRLRLQVGGGPPGLIALDGRTVVPVEDCPIAHPRIAELIPLLDAELPEGIEVTLRVGTRTGDRLLLIADAPGVIDEIAVDLDASVVLARPDGSLHVVAGQSWLTEEVAGRRYVIPAPAFFQVNTEMTEVLLETVRGMLPERVGTLVDAYCGIGLFGVALADRAEQVFCVDHDPLAIAAAVENAEGLDNITLIEGPADEGLAHVSGPIDALIVDPPRAGLDDETHALLAARRPRVLVYVSCEPATLARDLRRLRGAGYALERCVPIDMFPQTHHVETVSRLRLEGGSAP